jgi:DivIVA domain-containing protein
VTGDEVRDARFVRPRGSFARGYDAAEVDELLPCIAAEVDAGRPVGPMIEKAVFRARTGRHAYETGAVDWFLELIRCTEDHSELARMSDPWRGWPAANYFSRRGPGDRAQDLAYLALECAEACRDFGRVPGTQLRWVVTPGRYPYLRGELHTADQREIATVRTRTCPVLKATVGTGGSTFTWRRVTGSARPGIAGQRHHDRGGSGGKPGGQVPVPAHTGSAGV